MSLYVTWKNTYNIGGYLMIGLEDGLERKKKIYVSYKGLEVQISVFN